MQERQLEQARTASHGRPHQDEDKKRRRKSEYFASRGGVGVADDTLGETAVPALPGRPAISLAKQHLLLRKETHHQRARLLDLLTPGGAGVNGKKRTVSTKKTIEQC